jgi:hypothetical protein
VANIIAIATYGSQRVKPPFSKTRVSAYKIGYINAGRAVLLALLNDQARVVSPLQARYHYIQIDVDVTVRYGYILLNVTDEELGQTEALTLQVTYPAIYRWHNGVWHEFPTRDNPEYHLPPDRRGPSFNPDTLRIGTTSGDKESATPDRITAQQDNGWWWLRGDTYPHRETLKRFGCRWSKKRRAWYYIGQALPDAVQALLTLQDDVPCSDEEAEAILGVPLKLQPKPETPALFAVDDTVYARHELLTSDDVTVPTGAKGIVTKVYNRNPTHGWSYDVQFDEIGTGWFVEDELTSLEMPFNIRITKGAIIPEPDPIQIIKPAHDDAMRETIRQIKPKTIQSSPKTGLIRIPQQAVGELTGSIAGNVYCYGYAVHDEIAVYVNMAGPRMAVEAIRAKFAKGEAVNLHRWDAPTLELTSVEGETGKYASYFHNIPSARLTSLILVHERMLEPNYGGKSTTFILEAYEAQVIGQLKHHITELVNIPVFDEWASYLWEAGRSAQLVRKAQGEGGLIIYAVDLDIDAWTRIITGGLSEKIILLPVSRYNETG